MASAYRVQIVDAQTGLVVYHDVPGMVAEVELIENLRERVRAKRAGTDAVAIEAVCAIVAEKGVGVGRTEAHVLSVLRETLTSVGMGRPEDQVVADVGHALEEFLLDLKRRVPPKRS